MGKDGRRGAPRAAGGKTGKRAEREVREAEALKRNLARRKAQTRARTGSKGRSG